MDGAITDPVSTGLNFEDCFSSYLVNGNRNKRKTKKLAVFSTLTVSAYHGSVTMK